MEMDWSPIRDPAMRALAEVKAGKSEEIKTTIKELVTLVDQMNSTGRSSGLEAMPGGTGPALSAAGDDSNTYSHREQHCRLR